MALVVVIMAVPARRRAASLARKTTVAEISGWAALTSPARSAALAGGPVSELPPRPR